MADKSFDVLIDIRTQLQGLQAATQQLAGARKEAEGFNSAFKIGGAVEITRRLTEALSEVPRQLLEGIKAGLEFNKLLEQSRLGVAGVLKQFDSTSYKDFNAALGDSNRLIELLRGKANQLGLSFEGMLEQYRTTAGALFAGGVRDLQKQVDLTVLLQQAMASLGIQGFQAQRDIFDLLEGRASRTVAGKALGISDADVEKAKEAGKLYEFLETRLGAVAEAGAKIGNTFGAAEQRAKNLLQQLEGIATKDFFGDLKKQLDALNESLAKPQTAETVSGIANLARGAVAGLSEAVGGIIASFKQLDAQLESIDHIEETMAGFQQRHPGLFADILDVGKAKQFVEQAGKLRDVLLEQVRSATTLKEQNAARQSLDAAIAAAQERVKTSTGDTHTYAEQLLHDLENMKTVFPAIVGAADRMRAAMQGTAEQAERAIKAANGLQNFRADTASRQATLAGDDDKAFGIDAEKQRKDLFNSLTAGGTDPVAAAREVEARMKVITAEYEKQKSEKESNVVLDEQGIEVLRLRAAGETDASEKLDRTTKIQQEFNKLQKEGVKDEGEAWRLATVKVDSEKQISEQKKTQHSSQKETNLLLREESDLLRDIRDNQKLISESPFLSADAKQSQLHELFIREQAEVAAQSARVAQALQAAYGAGNQEEVEKLKQKLHELGVTSQELSNKISTTSFTGAFGADLVQWANSFGTAAHQAASVITGTLNTAIGATSQALTGLIFKTGNWKQAFASAAQAIVQNIIQVALQFIVSRTVMFAINKLFGKADSQAVNQEASSAAAAWSPAAVAASTASYGAAAGAGVAAYLAAIALGTAGATAAAGAGGGGGGFMGGGYTGDIATHAIAGVVHGQETVISASATAHYGRDLMEAFNDMRIPVRRAGYAGGGSVGGGGFSSSGNLSLGGGPPVVHIFAVNNLEDAIDGYHKSDAAEKRIINIVNGNSYKISGS